MKITVCGVKNTLERMNRLDNAEENISEHNDRPVEVI